MTEEINLIMLKEHLIFRMGNYICKYLSEMLSRITNTQIFWNTTLKWTKDINRSIISYDK